MRRENDFIQQELLELRNKNDFANTRQKNEFSDMYGAMKRDSDDLKKEIRQLNFENEKLLKQLELSRGIQQQPVGAMGADKETQKRLKKRELECQALWDTLKDLQIQRGVFDARQMLDVLARRALDTKARRKLAI